MTTTALRSPRAIFRRVSGPRGALLGFLATLSIALIALVGTSTAVGLSSSGRILPGVTMGGIAIGGLDRAAAAAHLEAQLPSLSTGQATVIVDGESAVVPFAEIGRGYELDRMVDAAYAVGREGHPFITTGARVRSVLASTEMPVIVHAFDRDALDAVAVRLALRFSGPPSAAAVTLVDGAFVVEPAVIGTRLNPRDISAALAAVAATSDPADVTIELTATTQAPRVTTAAAEAAAEAAAAMAGSDLALTLEQAAEGDEPLSFTTAQLQSLITFGDVDGAFGPTLDRAAAETLVAGLAEQVNQEATNATFAFGDGGPTGVIAGQVGHELDVQASLTALSDALAERASGATVPSMALATAVTEPALTTAAAEAALPQMRRLSTWTTYYVPGIANYWGANISIPAWHIDGRTLAPGEWFSFWDGIGEVSYAAGYGAGGAIINGRSQPTGALAGGICSTSTTIFNAALRAGLEMGDRTNHSYYISRYPLGLDATVLKTDTYTTDMTFRNDTEHPILIRGYAADGFVRFDLWGVPTGRTVSFSAPYVTNQRAARDLTITDPSLAPGTAVRDESPHNGMNVSVTRWVHDANGDLLYENNYFSPYRTVDGITRVGAAPPPEDPPDPA